MSGEPFDLRPLPPEILLFPHVNLKLHNVDPGLEILQLGFKMNQDLMEKEGM